MKTKILLLSFISLLFLSTGKAQNVGVFNGSSYAKITTAPTYVTTYTLSAWVKFANLTGNHAIASWNCASGQIFFRTEGANLYYRMWNGGAVAVKNNTTLVANTWYHIAVVLNAGVVSIFINGVDDTNPVPAAGTNSFPTIGTTTSFSIGTTASNNAESHNGNIDNFNYWTVAKSPAQVGQIMNSTLVGNEANLKLFLDFENNLTDKSTSAYSLTNTGITYSANTLTRITAQTLTFGTLDPITVSSSDVALNATATSNLPVGFSSSNTSVATIVNGKIHPMGPGDCIITAYQSGNATYLAATSVNQTLIITAIPNNYDLSFTGNGYLTSTTTAAPFGATFSISGWFKPSTGNNRCIATWSTQSTGDIGNFLRLESDNFLYFGQWNGSFKKIKCNTQINTGLWSHIAMVKNNNGIKFYVNGVENAGTYVSGTAPMDNNAAGDNFRFGIQNFNNAFVDGWIGEMDNLNFHTTARTAADIQTEFSSGVNKNGAGIWGYWSLNDMKNPTADSSSLNLNHLALANINYLVSDINAIPEISAFTNGFVNNTTARAYLTSLKGGTVYWGLYQATTVITDATVIQQGTGAISKGSFAYQTPGIMDFFNLKGLTPNTQYVVYATLQGSNKLSAVSSTTFTTTNTTIDLTSHINSVKGVLSRLIPGRDTEFDFAAIDKIDDTRDVFELSTVGSKILVKGSSATAITSGINYYLHNYCNASFSWNGDQNILPSPLPIVSGTIRKETPYQYRYSFNYCTHNYTMSFWDWARWEREIDLMAMQGVNVFLSPIGSEAVWQKTLEHFGYSFPEIQNFIAGPSHTAWWLMDNLEGEGGKVSQAYIDARTALQKKIMARTKELGMSVVLQGYAGMVPTTFAAKVPTATVVAQGDWCGYTRPPVVTGAVCDSVAKYWYIESVKLFGAADFYGGDAFHEGGIIPNGFNLANYATQLQSWMLKTNPKSTWVLQAWSSNPKTELLNGIKKDQCLIINYSNDLNWLNHNWDKRNGYNGYPWVYGVINNFGGRMGIYARLQQIATGVYNMQQSSMKGNNVGIGIAPEAIIYNQVSYDLIWDLAWETSAVTTSNWISKFADRRYGTALENTQKAWQTLNTTALACTSGQEGGSESIINARPSLTVGAISCCATSNIYYTPSAIIPAWTNMMNSIDVLKDKTTFKFDLVDISRQVLSNYAKQVHTEMVSAFNTANKPLFNTKSTLFLEMMLDQDSLLRTREEFLLGKWISDARALGTTPAESDIFELDARALPTTWNTKYDGVLHEYAHHEWAGLTKDFYRERWELFIADLNGRLNGSAAQNINFFTAFEKPWIDKKGNDYDIVPTGKEIELATYIYNKYMPLMGYTLTNVSPIVNEQTFTIAEKQAVGSTVGNVIATDANADQTLSYEIYNQSVAGAFSINSTTGKLTVAKAEAMDAITNPSITLIVKVSDNGTPSYSVYRKIRVNLSLIAGIDILNTQKPMCYPNPAKNQIYLKSPNGFQGSIKIVDLSGKLLLVKEIKNPTINEVTLSLADLSSGSYLIYFKSNKDESIRLKFSK